MLHTRVPAVLEDELKRLATNLRMPVSNVVRAILEDAIEAVEVVGVRAEDELKGFVTKLSEQREAIRQGASHAVRSATQTHAVKARDEADPTDVEVSEAQTNEAQANEADHSDAANERPATSAPTDTQLTDTSVLADVIGFDRLTLRRDATCAVCGEALPRGEDAWRGIRDGGPSVLVCARCSLL